MRAAGRLVAVLAVTAALLATAPTARARPLDTAPPPTSVLLQPVRHVEVPGARLGYRVGGQGPPLVLIAGFAVTMAEWEADFVDRLARDRRVIVFDNRGVATSSGSVARLTVAQMARDTAALIRAVVGGPADVLGWSMGGFIAQELAIEHPDVVRGVVLASTSCGGPASRPIPPPVLATLSSPTATPDERLGILFPRDHLADGEAWLASIAAVFSANGQQPADSLTVAPATEKAQLRVIGPLWYGRGQGTCRRLDRITAPTLVAAGRQDVVIPAVNHRAMSRGIPGAVTRVYADAGHAFLFQPGLRFADEVDRFLRR